MNGVKTIEITFVIEIKTNDHGIESFSKILRFKVALSKYFRVLGKMVLNTGSTGLEDNTVSYSNKMVSHQLVTRNVYEIFCGHRDCPDLKTR